LVTQWTLQPVAIVVAAVLALGYLDHLRRASEPWSRWRISGFTAGLALLVWASCGFLAVYASSLYWVWTTQTLTLWLVVPILVLSGHPVQLARAAGRGRVVDRFLASPFSRVIANPLIGPGLVPVLSFALFFGPVAGWAIRWTAAGWALQFVLLVVGALMVLPLAGLAEDATSLAVGLGLLIGSFELVLDALPGVILRLKQTLATTWFDFRDVYHWSPDPLHDQRVAGAVLWCIAELIDLPFLLLVYRRWLRADARDAAAVDAVLEAERAARRSLTPDEPPPLVERDAPWWLSDPSMSDRVRHQGD
jgi:cytochrome c oxidase assembly factor CtaG